MFPAQSPGLTRTTRPVAAPLRAVGSGRFWHDREPRPAHYFPWTRETGADQEKFWENVNDLAPLKP